MLFAGWEVRMMKNCDRGLENAETQDCAPLQRQATNNQINYHNFKTRN